MRSLAKLSGIAVAFATLVGAASPAMAHERGYHRERRANYGRFEQARREAAWRHRYTPPRRYYTYTYAPYVAPTPYVAPCR